MAFIFVELFQHTDELLELCIGCAMRYEQFMKGCKGEDRKV